MLCAVRSHKDTDKEPEFDLRDCKLLGEGHNGIVYRLPDGHIIKIFKEKKHCKNEYDILKKAHKSPYFPKAYYCGENYIIRDYVDGTCAMNYIKHNGLSERLALNIMSLLEEFKKLKFTKLDIRCRDIYVQPDESIMVIDPKGFLSRKVDFPRHLSKGLKKLDVLDDFLQAVKSVDEKLYEEWTGKIKEVKSKR